MNFGAKTRLRHSYFRGNRDGSLSFLLELLHRTILRSKSGAN